MPKLRPKCFYNEIQTSLTNRGHLIPCCNVDQPETLADPMMVKMLKVSKLSEVDKVEDILDMNKSKWKVMIQLKQINHLEHHTIWLIYK